MTSITTRAGKGAELTWDEMDANLNNLNNNKLEKNNATYTGTFTGSTGVLNIGSGQIYKDASGHVGIGITTPTEKLHVNGNAIISGFTIHACGNPSTTYSLSFGSDALTYSSTGFYNTSIGVANLLSNTTGYENTATGAYALTYNTVGHSNTAHGTYALGGITTTSNNSAFGASSFATASGSNNTGIGCMTGAYTETGSSNTFIGYNAGSQVTTGSYNVIIGGNTGSGIATASNRIIISDGAGNVKAYYSSPLWTMTGDMAVTGKVYFNQSTPASTAGNNTTPVTLTSANLLTNIILATPTGGTTVYNLPTGTDVDSSTSMADNYAFDWCIINKGLVAITLTAATGHTIEGNVTVSASNTNQFRTRKTTANTFITYRIS